MEHKWRKLIGYYKPYQGLFWLDMLFAILGAGVTLVIPLIVRYITNHVIYLPDALEIILKLGAVMLALTALEAFNRYTYSGHIMGAKMERDMRAEIFAHYQKLSFSSMIIRRWGSCSPV